MEKMKFFRTRMADDSWQTLRTLPDEIIPVGVSENGDWDGGVCFTPEHTEYIYEAEYAFPTLVHTIGGKKFYDLENIGMGEEPIRIPEGYVEISHPRWNGLFWVPANYCLYSQGKAAACLREVYCFRCALKL